MASQPQMFTNLKRGVPAFADAAPVPRLALVFPYGLNENVTVHPGECTSGYNFDLQAFRTSLNPRKPFDRKGTATNEAKITSFLQLVKRDNSETTLVVAGTTVYSWDGGGTFTSKATGLNADALLRDTYWSLDDYIIITDLNLNNVVKKWDGTTFSDMTHTGIVGNLYAKFAVVHLNRVWLFNIKVGSTEFPDMILACKFDDPTNWDSSTRGGPTTVGGGSFATGLEAFYLKVPDLKPINGVTLFQDRVVFSTQQGRIWQITGASAADFQVTDFFDTAPAIGTNALQSIGNDVLFPRQGNALTLLYATQAFGNALQSNAGHWIPTTLATVTQFNEIVYDVTNQRALLFVNGRVLVLYKDILAQDRNALQAGPSPWGIYTTLDSESFNTVAAKYMLRPGTTTYSVFFGDVNGRIFDLYGTNTDGDASDADAPVQTIRRSRHIGSEVINPWPFIEENITGHVRYRRMVETSLTVSLEWDDEYNTTQNVVTLKGPPANDTAPYFGGNIYFGGSFYFNQGFSAANMSSSMNLSPGGKGPGFHITLSASSAQPWQVDSVELN
jgi:hypothetical protein